MSLEEPFTSYTNTPIKILPSPKVTPAIKKYNVRCQKLEILSSSPFKDAIEKKNEIKTKLKLVFNQTRKMKITKGKENKNNEIETNRNQRKGKRKVKGKVKKLKTTRIWYKIQNSPHKIMSFVN